MNERIRPWGDTPVIDDEDRKRLKPHFTNGKVVIAYLNSGKATIDDLKRIIIMEYTESDYKRQYILDRLFSRLAKLQRYEAEKVLNIAYTIPKCSKEI